MTTDEKLVTATKALRNIAGILEDAMQVRRDRLALLGKLAQTERVTKVTLMEIGFDERSDPLK